jgi:hypothetical protein
MSASQYKPILIQLISFLNNQQYNKDHEFTEQELGVLTPADVLRWMNLKSFGVPNPPDDANPTQARSNSLKYWKKAISHFMPNKLMAWNRLSNQGNPTRSIEINDLIKRVKKKEVQKQGAPSQTRRPMSGREFHLLHGILKASNDTVWRHGITCLINFQFHLIARIDDTTQLLMDHLRVHDSFSYALKARLNWSKNVQD